MNKVKQSHWCMEGRHNDEVHCTNCNHAVGAQYDEEDNITGVPMVCPKCASIYDDVSVIEDKIRKFHCHNCEFLLSEELVKFINN